MSKIISWKAYEAIGVTRVGHYIEFHGCLLKRTCNSHPEQYDVFLGETEIGYLRLRHGLFTVDYIPDKKEILRSFPRGDGEFIDDERYEYLDIAVKLLIDRHLGKGVIILRDEFNEFPFSDNDNSLSLF